MHILKLWNIQFQKFFIHARFVPRSRVFAFLRRSHVNGVYFVNLDFFQIFINFRKCADMILMRMRKNPRIDVFAKPPYRASDIIRIRRPASVYHNQMALHIFQSVKHKLLPVRRSILRHKPASIVPVFSILPAENMIFFICADNLKPAFRHAFRHARIGRVGKVIAVIRRRIPAKRRKIYLVTVHNPVNLKRRFRFRLIAAQRIIPVRQQNPCIVLADRRQQFIYRN